MDERLTWVVAVSLYNLALLSLHQKSFYKVAKSKLRKRERVMNEEHHFLSPFNLSDERVSKRRGNSARKLEDSLTFRLHPLEDYKIVSHSEACEIERSFSHHRTRERSSSAALRWNHFIWGCPVRGGWRSILSNLLKASIALNRNASRIDFLLRVRKSIIEARRLIRYIFEYNNTLNLRI